MIRSKFVFYFCSESSSFYHLALGVVPLLLTGKYGFGPKPGRSHPTPSPLLDNNNKTVNNTIRKTTTTIGHLGQHEYNFLTTTTTTSLSQLLRQHSITMMITCSRKNPLLSLQQIVWQRVRVRTLTPSPKYYPKC